jgi:transposase
MNVVYERCCGLDIHKKSVVACLLTPQRKQIRTFGTMTVDILQLADWLLQEECTHVAMESTGVYWKPIYNLLEGYEQFELLVVNAQHIKAVPGRKTDVKDAEWIADLLRHGLLRGSFIPSAEQRDLRELTRYRTTLVRERADTVNRLQKVLEDANIKLASVATDITGVSGRAMLEGLLAGQCDPAVLAELAKGRLREKSEALVAALAGRVRKYHRFMIAEHLAQIDYLEAAIERVSAEIEERVRPFVSEGQLEQLDSVPGISKRVAQVLVGEIGTDMHRFPSARHLASWAGLCPGNNQSGGKQLSGRIRKGSPWLKQVLMEAAHGAVKVKGSYLAAQYHRLAARRGSKRAMVAVAHSILVIVYHVLRGHVSYQELGGNYFDERERQMVAKRAVRRLEQLGYHVHLEPRATPCTPQAA